MWPSARSGFQFLVYQDEVSNSACVSKGLHYIAAVESHIMPLWYNIYVQCQPSCGSNVNMNSSPEYGIYQSLCQVVCVFVCQQLVPLLSQILVIQQVYKFYFSYYNGPSHIGCYLAYSMISIIKLSSIGLLDLCPNLCALLPKLYVLNFMHNIALLCVKNVLLAIIKYYTVFPSYRILRTLIHGISI